MILVCGEALVDLFLYDRQGSRITAEAVAGGSPFNVAIGLARLGCQSAFCSGLSTDSFGEFLSGILVAENVSLDYAVRTPRLSTISVVATDTAGRAQYSFHGEGAADRSLTIADLKPGLGSDINAITFGSYTLAAEPVASVYLALATREKTNRVISVDPNVRPTVVGDLASYGNRFLHFVRTATLVKASEEDIALLYGESASIANVARAWLKEGPALVIVTRGAAGAVGFHRERRVEAPGREVNVVDTVGAGDSFHAAFLACLDRQGRLEPQAIRELDMNTLEHALRYSVAAASITCSRRGALLPYANEVEALLKDR